MNLNELLCEYKELTLKIINEINSENDIQHSLCCRQDILDRLSTLNSDKSEIKREVDVLKIQEYEEKAQILIKNKMLETRKEIKKLKQSQAAYNKYSNFNGSPIIFSTQR